MEASQHPNLYQKAFNLVGVSFRTLPVEVRERLVSAGSGGAALLQEVAGGYGLNEAAILSTCNRFEIISIGNDAEQRIVDFFEAQLERTLTKNEIYRLRDREAVRHLFRVAASLDSMVIGEAQILGQVKAAYRNAVDVGLADKHLHHLFQFAFSLAKRVRSRTGVAESGVSLSYIAVRLAEQIFGSLADRTVLIIGSGRMAELALLHLRSHGCGNVIVANRTVERAAELALRVGGTARSLDDLPVELERADVVIGSISIDRPVIEASLVRKRKNRSPLFFIDLGVPRNFSPLLGELDGVYLYDVDDLSTVADENRTLREEASHEADLLIDYGLMQFERWLMKTVAEPRILELRERVRSVCSSEIRRAMGGESGSVAPTVLDELTHRISAKLSHDLTEILSRNPGATPTAEELLPLIAESYLDVS